MKWFFNRALTVSRAENSWKINPPKIRRVKFGGQYRFIDYTIPAVLNRAHEALAGVFILLRPTQVLATTNATRTFVNPTHPSRESNPGPLYHEGLAIIA